MNNYNEILDATPLHRILDEAMQAENNLDGNPNKWKVPSTGEHIQLSGQSWYSWQTNKGGNGAISLLTYYLKLTSYQTDIQAQAIDILLKMNEKLLLKEELDNNLSQQGDIPKRKV